MTTTPRFDELIHAPTRLSIVALLGASDWAEFRFIRESLGLSDSALSKQLTLLEDAGYVQIRKAFVGKRPRTWARLSGAGRVAFEGHVQRLREIVNASGMSLDETPGIETMRSPEPESSGVPGAIVRA
jgi:DNA-binding transcriptional ArsR family regulator